MEEMQTHTFIHTLKNTAPCGGGDLSGKAILCTQCYLSKNKGALVVKEVMRKLGDAQLVLRLKAFLWLWQTVKS